MNRMTEQDLMLCLLYSEGKNNTFGEGIYGKCKLERMMYILKKELYYKYFDSKIKIDFTKYEPSVFGPYSQKFYDNLAFFQSISFVKCLEIRGKAIDDGKFEFHPLSFLERAEMQYCVNTDIFDEKDLEDLNLGKEIKDLKVSNKKAYEPLYYLSTEGKSYVKSKLWCKLSKAEKEQIKELKIRIQNSSFDDLCDYVNQKYPNKVVAV